MSDQNLFKCASVEDFKSKQLLLASRVMKHLPIIDTLGWNGDPNGFLPYFNWRADGDLFIALIDFHSSPSSRRKDLRSEIITRFYGGEESYKNISRQLLKAL